MTTTRSALIFTATSLLFLGSCAGVPRGHTTALHEAATQGDIDEIQILISEESDVDIRDEDGRTALHHSAISGDIIVMAALLNAGADPDLTDVEGRAALHYAAITCNPDLAAILLGADANPDIRDDEDETALDIAERSACEEVVQTIQSAY